MFNAAIWCGSMDAALFLHRQSRYDGPEGMVYLETLNTWFALSDLSNTLKDFGY